MAKRGQARWGRPEEHEAQELLQGRARTDVRRLVDLIRAVNPTGRDASGSEVERRYRLKSGLQSLLIREHGGDLEFEPDGDDPNLVLVRHRGLGVEACHAAIDSLDLDARSFVRLRLDTSEGNRPPAPPPTDASHAAWRPRRAGPGDSLAEGEQALAEYDFDAARACFEGALGDPRLGVRAARKLLSLLVDQLAADEDAVALEEALSASEAGDPEVRELLALAAARCSLPERALVLLKGLETPRAAEALAVLARQALGEGDLDEAARRLALAKERDAALPVLSELERALDKARAESRKPLEEAALRAWERGDRQLARLEAQQVLVRWPDSAAARQVLRKADDADRVDRVRRLLAEAVEAALTARFDDAAARLREAASLGEPGLEGRIAQADQAAQAARDEAAVRATGELFSGQDRPRAIEAFLALEPRLRDRLRERDRAAAWAEALCAAGAKTRPATQAALALDEAHRAAAAEGPQRALDLAAPYLRVLEQIDPGRSALESWRAQLSEAKRTAAEEALGACEAALAAGDLFEARRQFDRLDASALSPGRRPAVQDAQSRLSAALRRHDLAARAASHEAHGDLFDALDCLDELARLEPEGGWSGRASELRARMRREWRFRSESVDLRLPSTEFWLDPYVENPLECLSLDGLALLATNFGRWVFARFVDLRSGRVVRQAALRTPIPLGGADVVVEQAGAWLVGEGAALRVSCDFEPLRFKDLGGLLPSGELVERVVAVPGTGLLWVGSRERAAATEALSVVDARQWRTVRRLGEQLGVAHLPTEGEPRVVCTGFRDGATLFTARGTSASTIPPLERWRVHAVAEHPSGEGLVAVVSDPTEENRELKVVPAMSAGADRERPVELPGSELEESVRLATSRSARTSFVLFQGEEGRTLLALEASGHGLRERYVIPAPPDAQLVQDATGLKVALLVGGAEGLCAVELGASEPVLPPPRPALVRGVAPTDPAFWGCSPKSVRRAHELALTAQMTSMDDDTLAAHASRYRQAHADDPEALLAFVPALPARLGSLEEKRKTFEHAFRHHPKNAEVAVRWAEHLLSDGQVSQARAALEDLPSVPVELARHHAHLLGSARLRSGDRGAALAAWRQGLAFEGSCDLEACLSVAREDTGRMPREEWSASQPAQMQALGALREADYLLTQGNARDALREIDIPAVRVLHDLQAHARLAACHLALEPTSPGERFEKAMALAVFVSTMDSRSESRCIPPQDMPIAGAWPTERLEELAARCRAWLDAF